MIIESMIKESDYCGMVASTPEHVYNAWVRSNTLHFYVLSNDKKCDVLNHFIARIENGKIKLVIDGDLIDTIGCAFPDEWHDIITIIETLLYIVE